MMTTVAAQYLLRQTVLIGYSALQDILRLTALLMEGATLLQWDKQEQFWNQVKSRSIPTSQLNRKAR